MKDKGSNRYGWIAGLTIWILSYWTAEAQRVLSLDSCLSMAERNYPQIQQKDLLRQSAEYNLETARAGKLPRVQLMGQASYQSAVTGLPDNLPFAVTQISKDQYRLYGEVIQPLTDLAVVNQHQKIVQASSEMESASLEVKLYSIRQRVSDLFFGILLLQGQSDQLRLTQEELERGLKQIKAAKANGVAYQSQVDQLRAEMLSLDQKAIQLESSIKGFKSMLSLFVGQESDEPIELSIPETITWKGDINRPELRIFSTQQRLIDLQSQMLDKQNLPKFMLFFQGGLGRPALNMLDNDLAGYYIGGLRLSWNLSNFYTSAKQKQLFTVSRNMFENEKETFLFNLDLALTSKYIEIAQMAELVDKDEEIIALREKVVESSRGQLANGVITANEYKNIVADADKARQSLNLHQIEWLKKQNEYKLTAGN
jgi:outer membrane protein TolC